MQDNFWKDLLNEGRKNFSAEDFRRRIEFFYFRPEGRLSLADTPEVFKSKLSISKRLWDFCEAPTLRALSKSYEKRGAYSLDKLIRGYLLGGPIVRRMFAMFSDYSWAIKTETPPQEISHGPSEPNGPALFFIPQMAREFGFYLCLNAAGGWPDGGDFLRFVELYMNFSRRFWIAVFCRDEIARRIHEYKIRSLLVQFIYGRRLNPDTFADLERAIATAMRPGARNMDSEDLQNQALDFVKRVEKDIQATKNEADQIKYILSMATTGMRAQSQLIDHRRRTQTKLEEAVGRAEPLDTVDERERQEISKFWEGMNKIEWELSRRPDDEDDKRDEGDKRKVSLMVLEILGTQSGDQPEPCNWSDEEKSLLTQRCIEICGKKVGKTFEALLSMRFKSGKEIAESLSRSESMISRDLSAIENKIPLILEVLGQHKGVESILRDAEREALKSS